MSTPNPAIIARAERVASVAYVRDTDPFAWKCVFASALAVLIEQDAASAQEAIRPQQEPRG